MFADTSNQMMRYRGKFGRAAYPDIVCHPSDEGKVLEDKWKRWYELESWKRQVYNIRIQTYHLPEPLFLTSFPGLPFMLT